jgi:hypothetical protein
MTERWQRELSKLRSAELPDEVWDRAQRGPTGDGLPPRRERIVAGVVAAVVFLAAGSFAWQTLRETGPSPGGARSDQAALALEVVDSPGAGGFPQITLAYGGVETRGTPMSYTWGNSIVDTIALDLAHRPFFPIPQGTVVSVSGSAPSAEVWLADRTSLKRMHDLSIVDGRTRLDADPGRYALGVTGSWSEGKVTFYFPLDLTAPGAQPPTASLRFGSDGATALTIDGATVAATPTEAELKHGTVSVRVVSAPSAPIEVPTGTQIWVAGDRPRWLSMAWWTSQGDSIEQTVPVSSPAIEVLGPGMYQLLVGFREQGSGAVGSSFSIRVVDLGLQPTPPPSRAELRVIGHGGPPVADLSFGGSSITGERGTYCWDQAGVGSCADAAPFGPPARSIDLPLGTSIAIAGDVGKVQVTLTRLDPGTPFSSRETLRPGDLFSLPHRRGALGAYALDVFGTWPEGDADFQFGIHLVAPDAAPAVTPTPTPTAAADVGRVVCRSSGAEVLTPTVAAQRDGVRISFENLSSARQYELRGPSDPLGSGQGGRLEGSTTTRTMTLEPGRWTVACVDPRQQGPVAVPSATFTVIDPAGYWVPWNPTCGNGEVNGRIAVIGGLAELDPAAAATAFAPYLRGLGSQDGILKPGYVSTSFKVPTYVVVRDGVVVARLVVIRSLQLTMCRGSHLDVARTPEEALACLSQDRVPVAPTGNMLDQPGGAAFITVNIPGILQSDAVVQVTAEPAGQTVWSGAWDVVRDGSVLAVFDFDSLHGTACAGSGIGGA